MLLLCIREDAVAPCPWRRVSLIRFMLSFIAPTATQMTERSFPETGFCISGLICTDWERNGGPPFFGYTITPPAGDACREPVG